MLTSLYSLHLIPALALSFTLNAFRLMSPKSCCDRYWKHMIRSYLWHRTPSCRHWKRHNNITRKVLSSVIPRCMAQRKIYGCFRKTFFFYCYILHFYSLSADVRQLETTHVSILITYTLRKYVSRTLITVPKLTSCSEDYLCFSVASGTRE